MKMKLLITDTISKRELVPLKKYFTIDIRLGLSKGKLANVISNYEGIITRGVTALPASIITNGKKLRVIGRVGLGVDTIDVQEASRRGIAVLNAPKSIAKSRASQALQLLRRVVKTKGKNSLKGRVLGIVGFGDVGKHVAYRAYKRLGMKVRVCEPYGEVPSFVTKVTYEELLQESDIVSMHVPFTYLTRSMVNHATLSLCKKGAYLLNCSRARVVEEDAVLKGIKEGILKAFGAIVYGGDQMSPRLKRHPSTVFFPHQIQKNTSPVRSQLTEVVAGIVQYLQGDVPENLVNPQVFRKKARGSYKLGFDAIIFDCDSTLSSIEGIVELARLVGKEKEVADLTRKVMEGILPFESVFEKRLEMIAPHRDHLDVVGRRYIDMLVEDAKGMIAALMHLGKSVYVVSGGYTQALLTLGSFLGIPSGNIYGNDLLFDDVGNYAGSIGGPLRRNWGKLQIIRRIPGRKLMVGDSITDLETKECVDLFVGYGGVARIAKVEQESLLYLYCQSLSPIVVIAAGVEGCLKLLPTRFRRYVGKGLDLLSHPKHVKTHTSLTKHLAEYKEVAYY